MHLYARNNIIAYFKNISVYKQNKYNIKWKKLKFIFIKHFKWKIYIQKSAYLQNYRGFDIVIH